MWGYLECGVVYGGAFGIGRIHMRMLSEAKDWSGGMHELHAVLVKRALSDGKAEAWTSGAFGYLVLSGPLNGWLWVIAA